MMHLNRLAAKVISARGSLTLATFLGKFCAEIWHKFQHKIWDKFRAEIWHKFQHKIWDKFRAEIWDNFRAEICDKFCVEIDTSK